MPLALPTDLEGYVSQGFRLEDIERLAFDPGISARGVILQLWMRSGAVVEFTGEAGFIVFQEIREMDGEVIGI